MQETFINGLDFIRAYQSCNFSIFSTIEVLVNEKLFIIIRKPGIIMIINDQDPFLTDRTVNFTRKKCFSSQLRVADFTWDGFI